MSREKSEVPYTSFYLRAPASLDEVVEGMARTERRTKTVILSLALEEYAERHHPDVYERYKRTGA